MSKSLIRLTSSTDSVVVDSDPMTYNDAVDALHDMAVAFDKATSYRVARMIDSSNCIIVYTPAAKLIFQIVRAA